MFESFKDYMKSKNFEIVRVHKKWKQSVEKNKEGFYKTHRGLRDLFGEGSVFIQCWNKLKPETRVRVLRNKLDKRLKEDPDYEVFVPLVNIKCYSVNSLDFYFGKTKSRFYHPNLLISNKGRIYDLERNRFRLLSENKGYVVVTIACVSREIHRLLGISFVPKPIKHLKKPYELLVINHKNGKGDVNELWNIEWVTQAENIKHAYDNGLNNVGLVNKQTKPILFTSISDEGENTQFVICGKREMNDSGFSPRTVRRLVDKEKLLYGKWNIRHVSKDEVGKYISGIPSHIKIK